MSARTTASRAPLMFLSVVLLFAAACASSSSAGHPSAGHSTATPKTTARSAVAAVSGSGKAGAYLGLVQMGMPTAPQPFMVDAFAITEHAHHTINSHNLNGYGPPSEGMGEAMTSDHGTDCGPPPATHPMDGSYASSVFVCHDHMMTAGNAVGTGIIAFQPNQLVDFGSGPATVSINVSTFRTSQRDWLDFFFTPWNEQLAYVSDAHDGEPMKQPRDYLQVLVDVTNGLTYQAAESVGGVVREIPGDGYTTLAAATGLIPSKTVRTPIVFTLSQTHFRLVVNGHTFYDTALPVPFPATQVVFQAEHHNYDPAKTDLAVPVEQAALGLPAFANTWHWSNLAISSAVPYYQQMAMPEAAGDQQLPGNLGDTIHFAAAPAGSYLRFQGFDYAYTAFAAPAFGISFDGGRSWVPWRLMSGTEDPYEGSFFIPVPQGATSALLRGTDHWYARDFYVMSLAATNAPAAGAAPKTTP